MKLLILFVMWFLSIVDEFYLQGKDSMLRRFKQKTYWEEYTPNEKYKHDYKVALVIRAFSWSFMIHLPIICWLLYYHLDSIWCYVSFICTFVTNVALHICNDDDRTNRKRMNLLDEQLSYGLQVLITWTIWFVLMLK